MISKLMIPFVLVLLVLASGCVWSGFGTLVSPQQAGVSCRQNGYNTTCTYGYTSASNCPNIAPAQIEFIRSDAKGGITEELCGVYMGRWENGWCAPPYANARFTITSQDSEPRSIEYAVLPFITSSGAYASSVPYYAWCGSDPYALPNVYPRLSGSIRIIPITEPVPPVNPPQPPVPPQDGTNFNPWPLLPSAAVVIAFVGLAFWILKRKR